MVSSPLQKFTCLMSAVCSAGRDPVRFIFISNVVDLTWNIELGCQGEADRWWRGSTSLPVSDIQSEIVKRLSMSDVRVSGWKEKNTCMLKLAFELPQLKKFSVLLKEYSTEDSARRAMSLLFEVTLSSTNEKAIATSSRNLDGISVADLKLREREQTIQELRRRVVMLERTLESRPAPEAPPAPRRAPLIPKGASLANPSKRRRVIKDMRFDDE